MTLYPQWVLIVALTIGGVFGVGCQSNQPALDTLGGMYLAETTIANNVGDALLNGNVSREQAVEVRRLLDIFDEHLDLARDSETLNGTEDASAIAAARAALRDVRRYLLRIGVKESQ